MNTKHSNTTAPTTKRAKLAEMRAAQRALEEAVKRYVRAGVAYHGAAAFEDVTDMLQRTVEEAHDAALAAMPDAG